MEERHMQHYYNEPSKEQFKMQMKMLFWQQLQQYPVIFIQRVSHTTVQHLAYSFIKRIPGLPLHYHCHFFYMLNLVIQLS